MLRLTRATFAPASARARATPPVMPVPPPVTNATRPLRIPSENVFIDCSKVSTTRVSGWVEGSKMDGALNPAAYAGGTGLMLRDDAIHPECKAATGQYKFGLS